MLTVYYIVHKLSSNINEFTYLLLPMLGQYAEARADLKLATDYLKDSYAIELQGYTGDNVHYILDVLRPPALEDISTSGFQSSPEVVFDDIASGLQASELYGTSRRRKRNPDQLPQLRTVLASGLRFSPEIVSRDVRESTSGASVKLHDRSWRRWRTARHLAAVDQEYNKPEPEVNIVVLDDEPKVDITYHWNETTKAKYAERYTYVTRLLKIAHGLHYVGIAILGIFVVQVCKHLAITSCFSS